MDYINDIPPEIITKYNDHYILAVIGSRSITDKQIIFTNLEYLINLLSEHKLITDNKLIILSGKAKGVDSFAMEYARRNNILNINILPDWNKYGKRGGFVRNENIIKYSHRIIAFQTENSAGTQNGIDHAKRMKKKINVVKL